jgi:hypothetical protein
VLGLGYQWGGSVTVVEADPSGGNAMLTGMLRGQLVKPGLVELAKAGQAGLLSEGLARLAVPLVDAAGVGIPREILTSDPGQVWATPRLSLVPGSLTFEQAPILTKLWEPLMVGMRSVSASTGVDFLVDAGRLGLQGWPKAIVEAADVTVLCLRSSLREASGAAAWAKKLAAGEFAEHQLRLLLIGDGHPYPVRDIAKEFKVEALGQIPWDPKRARVFSDGAGHGRGFARSGYVAALRAVAQALQKIVHADQVPTRGNSM